MAAFSTLVAFGCFAYSLLHRANGRVNECWILRFQEGESLIQREAHGIVTLHTCFVIALALCRWCVSLSNIWRLGTLAACVSCTE